MMQITKVQKKYVFCSHWFFQSFNVTKHLYKHLLSVDVFCCQAQTTGHDFEKKTRKLAASMGPIPLEMYSVVMQKNVCEIPNSQRGVTSPSKDHCTDKLGSKYGANGAVVSRKRGVSSAVSPLQEAQLALRKGPTTPWWFGEIR